ncbi:5008_t:CDS:2 [Ambispora gerdemannii]|uniref:5008_t:CDS:1 n=1 Tax=Ambispora gerdemannii TaxID=144530 RepID=A0A9N9GDW5_9GLOM|nr:5008_t:CDS:2 [Ambispora gerdemannii]
MKLNPLYRHRLYQNCRYFHHNNLLSSIATKSSVLNNKKTQRFFGSKSALHEGNKGYDHLEEQHDKQSNAPFYTFGPKDEEALGIGRTHDKPLTEGHTVNKAHEFLTKDDLASQQQKDIPDDKKMSSTASLPDTLNDAKNVTKSIVDTFYNAAAKIMRPEGPDTQAVSAAKAIKGRADYLREKSDDVQNKAQKMDSNEDILGGSKQIMEHVQGKGQQLKDGVVNKLNINNTATVKDKGEQVKETIKDKGTQLKDTVQDKAQYLKETVQDKALYLKETVQDKAQQLKETVQDKAQQLKETVTGTVGEAKETIQDKSQQLKETVGETKENVMEKGKETVTGTVGEAKETIQDKSQQLKETVGETKESVMEKGKEVGEKFQEKGKEAKENIQEMGKEARENIMEKGKEKFQEKGKEAKENIQEIGKEARENIQEKGQHAKKAIQDNTQQAKKSEELNANIGMQDQVGQLDVSQTSQSAAEEEQQSEVKKYGKGDPRLTNVKPNDQLPDSPLKELRKVGEATGFQ